MPLALIVALVPLVIAPGFSFLSMSRPRSRCCCWAWRWRCPGLLPGSCGGREGRWLCILLALQAVSLILSTALSSRVALSVFGTNWRRFGLMTQLALLLFTALAAADLAGIGRVAPVSAGSRRAARSPFRSTASAQYFGWDPWIPKQAYHVGEGIWTIVRPPGTLGIRQLFRQRIWSSRSSSAPRCTRIEDSPAGGSAPAPRRLCYPRSPSCSAARARDAGALLVGAVWLWFAERPPHSQARCVRRSGWRWPRSRCSTSLPPGQMLRSRTRWYTEDAWGGSRLLLWRDSLSLAGRHLARRRRARNVLF